MGLSRETRGRARKAEGKCVNRTYPEWEKETGVQSSRGSSYWILTGFWSHIEIPSETRVGLEGKQPCHSQNEGPESA